MESEIRELDKELKLPGFMSTEADEADFWLQLPRTFSYQSSRFELPLDMSVLTDMPPIGKPMQYNLMKAFTHVICFVRIPGKICVSVKFKKTTLQ